MLTAITILVVTFLFAAMLFSLLLVAFILEYKKCDGMCNRCEDHQCMLNENPEDNVDTNRPKNVA